MYNESHIIEFTPGGAFTSVFLPLFTVAVRHARMAKPKRGFTATFVVECAMKTKDDKSFSSAADTAIAMGDRGEEGGPSFGRWRRTAAAENGLSSNGSLHRFARFWLHITKQGYVSVEYPADVTNIEALSAALSGPDSMTILGVADPSQMKWATDES